MPDPNPTPPPALAHDDMCFLLGEPMRWRIVRELAKGEALPVQELARRTGRSPSLISKHVAALRAHGVAVVGYGRLYSLAPAFRPSPDGRTIDFGHAVMKLDMPL